MVKKIVKSFVLIGLGCLAALGIDKGASYLKQYYPFKTIPRDNNVSEGYVLPSKLEIHLQNLDEKDGNETIIKYTGKDYLFRVNHREQPVVVPYAIKSAEILPGKPTSYDAE